MKAVPRFDSEDAERAFWATYDAADYFELAAARRVRLPNLRPSTQTISVRLPLAMLADLKAIANRLDIPYQSLMKVLIAEGIERRASESKALPEANENASRRPARGRRPTTA